MEVAVRIWLSKEEFCSIPKLLNQQRNVSIQTIKHEWREEAEHLVGSQITESLINNIIIHSEQDYTHCSCVIISNVMFSSTLKNVLVQTINYMTTLLTCHSKNVMSLSYAQDSDCLSLGRYSEARVSINLKCWGLKWKFGRKFVRMFLD